MTASGSIVTLTLNPALDVSTSVGSLSAGHKLRCAPPRSDPGGGGINVSRVCRRLGEPTIAVAPLGGPFGEEIERLLAAEAIPTVVVPVGGATRQSMMVREESTGAEFRFVLPGPALGRAEVEAACERAVEAAQGSRFFVLSGSLPEGTDIGVVDDLVEALPHAAVVVDTSGAALSAALRSGAHLVKPSARELARAVGEVLRTEAEVERAAQALMARSRVEVLIVSIGSGGAIVVGSSGDVIRLRAPTVQVRSTVGAGDSMVAGLVVGLNRGLGLEQAAALGVAAGTAAVLTDGTELCRAADVDALLPLVTVD